MIAELATAMRLRRLLAFAWVVVIGAACSAPPQPNVLLVSIDTLRADAVGAYGGPVATPALDGLARDGVLFEQAIAPASQTAPSHASLFTGQGVLRHGILRNAVPLDVGVDTLAELMQRAGYATAGFAASFVLERRFGWAQGFDSYDDEFPRRGESMRHRGGLWDRYDFEGFDRDSAAVNARALPWLAETAEPFFLFVHYFDTHAPYAVGPRFQAEIPAEFAQRVAGERFDELRKALPDLKRTDLARIVRIYHAEVLKVDRALGDLLTLLDERGLRDTTLVVVTADHGEGLGQHGTLDHAPHIYEEQVRVPLLLRWPGQLPAGRRIREPVGLIDVAPTIAALTGTEFPTTPDGHSLVPAMETGRVSEPLPIIGRRRRYEPEIQGHRGTKFFVRDGSWKYIHASKDPDELYDLASDPRELRNLHGANPETAARLRAHLDAALAEHPERDAAVAPGPEVQRGLEALGYIE